MIKTAIKKGYPYLELNDNLVENIIKMHPGCCKVHRFTSLSRKWNGLSKRINWFSDPEYYINMEARNFYHNFIKKHNLNPNGTSDFYTIEFDKCGKAIAGAGVEGEISAF